MNKEVEEAMEKGFLNIEDTAVRKEFLDIADYALEKLAKNNARGTVVLQKSQMDELNVDAREFSLMRTTMSSALSVTALIGQQNGSAGTNMLARDSVDKTIEAALEAAKSSEPDDGHDIAPGIGEFCSSEGPETCNLDDMYDRKREFMDTLAAEYPKIDLMQFITRFGTSGSLYANTNGTRAFSRMGNYSSSMTFSAREGDNTTSMNGAGVRAHEFKKPLLSYEHVKRLIEEMEPQLHTVPVQGKFTGTLLMSPDCFSELILSAIANAVSGTTLIDKTSPWLDKLGQSVADSRLNVLCDPFESRIVGRTHITGDGFLAEPVDVIKDGVLNSFLVNLYVSRKTGFARSGNYGSGYVVAPGDTALADMISGIDNGLLVGRFSGGAPAQNGDFSGVAKNSFLIKNGKITDAVTETMISGNLYEMLNNIMAISREQQIDGSTVIPWSAYNGVTISGK